MVIYGDKPLVFSCVTNSRIASCALELWRQEPTSPYRIPTRKELREFLCVDQPAITKLCRAEGFDWLPRAPVSRRRRPPASGIDRPRYVVVSGHSVAGAWYNTGPLADSSPPTGRPSTGSDVQLVHYLA